MVVSSYMYALFKLKFDSLTLFEFQTPTQLNVLLFIQCALPNKKESNFKEDKQQLLAWYLNS